MKNIINLNCEILNIYMERGFSYATYDGSHRRSKYDPESRRE